MREDRPDLLHVQYTAPLGCPVPVVVSVHDVSFLEHPEYFTREPRLAVAADRAAARYDARREILTGSEFSRTSILKVYGDLDEDKVVVVPNAAASGFRPISREAAAADGARTLRHSRSLHSFGRRPAAAQEPDRADQGLRASWCARIRS